MKYKLTNNTKAHNGVTLHQIQALKSFGDVEEGDLGGWIEKESNLSHEGDCWVHENALVLGDAQVSGNAQVYGNAWVSGNAQVCGDAQVSGNTEVFGDTRLFPINPETPQEDYASAQHQELQKANRIAEYWRNEAERWRNVSDGVEVALAELIARVGHLERKLKQRTDIDL